MDFFFFFLISVNISLGQKVTSYYLIRHAEKVLTNPNNPNEWGLDFGVESE